MEDYPRTLMELEQRFSCEEACREYLAAFRWSGVFRCPGCGGREATRIQRGLWLCGACRRQVSIMAGTVFQDSHLPLTTWFRAMWHVTSQKNGLSALGLQRVLGLGSYRTAWSVLHKLRRAMVRPGRERLQGVVEVDETYWGAEEEGVLGRRTCSRAMIVIAAEQDGPGIGRIRVQRVLDLSSKSLHGFIAQNIEPGSRVNTDGLPAYRGMNGYRHQPRVQRRQPEGHYLMPRAHRVASLMKRWLLGTHQGAVAHHYLDDYLNEFTFRFNRRKSASRGKLFFRLVQQAVQVDPVPLKSLRRPQAVVGC